MSKYVVALYKGHTRYGYIAEGGRLVSRPEDGSLVYTMTPQEAAAEQKRANDELISEGEDFRIRFVNVDLY